MHSPRTFLGASLALLAAAAPLSAIIDRNNDGLSDVWAALYRLPAGATAGADSDGDGQTNAQEALAGTDPRDAGSRFAVSPPQTDAAGNLVLRWRGAWGKRYLVESSADLTTWTALPELHIGRGQEISVIVRPVGGAAEPRRYWRVAVVDVDPDKDGMTNAEEIELGSDPTTADAALGTPRVYGAEYFVSTTGSDSNDGTKAKPFLTLEKAKAAVRTKVAAGVPAGGIAVWLRGGVYERTATFSLGTLDSGTSAANSVDWRGYPGEEVRLVGGKRLPASAFSLVTSASPVWNRLDATARGKVLQIDLKALGITDYGTLKERGFGKAFVAALELAVDGNPLPLARWPDVDQHTLPDIYGQSITVLSGTSVPAVGGTYRREATTDGVLRFKREGLVGGEQFYLFRYAWTNDLKQNECNWYIAPAITAGTPPANGFPSDEKVSWVCKDQAEPGHFFRTYVKYNSAGSPTVWFPDRIKRGYAFTRSIAATYEFNYGRGVGDRPRRWTAAPDAWVAGYWKVAFLEAHRRITRIAAHDGFTGIEFAPSPYEKPLGSEDVMTMGADQPWFAYNLLEEITRPGEWYLDRASGLLYLWPPAGFGPGSDVVVSRLEAPLVTLTTAKHIGFADLVVEAGRWRQVSAKDCVGLSLVRTTFRNAGDSALHLENGWQTTVRRCRLLDCGAAAIWMSGGDRKTLTRSGNVIEDCEFARYGRFQTSGVQALYLEGCGTEFRHNRVSDVPDRAVGYDGNEHRIEANELGGICRLSGDASAIYSGSWDVRGNTVHGNFIHDVGSSLFHKETHGVYIDDGGAGGDVRDNFFYRIDGAAFFFNGGRDNEAERNLVVDCYAALRTSQRALTLESDTIQNLLNKLHAVGYRSLKWTTEYPECALIPGTLAAIEAAKDTWLTPRGCLAKSNFGWRNGWHFFQDLPTAQAYFANGASIVTDNTLDSDPLFVDEAAGDLALRPGSPATAKLGWTGNPFERAGIRE